MRLWHREDVRLDSIAAVIDAETLLSLGDDPKVADLIYEQIGLSDLVIVNKADLVDEQELLRDTVRRGQEAAQSARERIGFLEAEARDHHRAATEAAARQRRASLVRA